MTKEKKMEYKDWEDMVEDIMAGKIENVDELIHVEKNDVTGEYTAWLGPWPCTIDGKDPEAVKAAAYDLVDLIVDQILGAYNRGENYGLAFYACGYDGEEQTEFVKYYADEYGVDVG